MGQRGFSHLKIMPNKALQPTALSVLRTFRAVPEYGSYV